MRERTLTSWLTATWLVLTASGKVCLSIPLRTTTRTESGFATVRFAAFNPASVTCSCVSLISKPSKSLGLTQGVRPCQKAGLDVGGVPPLKRPDMIFFSLGCGKTLTGPLQRVGSLNTGSHLVGSSPRRTAKHCALPSSAGLTRKKVLDPVGIPATAQLNRCRE